MLHWLDHYYISDGIHGNVAIQSKIDAGKAAHGIWLITLSDNPENICEMIPADLLIQRSLYDNCPLIIGMAKGKKEAIDLVKKLVEGMVKKKNGFDLREYIKNR